MSHTDKTHPWHVRMATRPGASAVPSHDHRFGPCDLPDLTPHTAGDISTSCYWAMGTAMLFGRDSGCGCGWCNGQLERRTRTRAERRDIAARLRAASRTADFDVVLPPRRRSSW